MESLMVFTISFVLIFIVYLIIYFVKRAKGKIRYMKEFDLLINKYKLKRNYLDYNKLGVLFVFLNSLIISITGTLCTMIKMKYIWQLVIGFALLMIFIYFTYGILGRILKKKQDKIEIANDYDRKKCNK